MLKSATIGKASNSTKGVIFKPFCLIIKSDIMCSIMNWEALVKMEYSFHSSLHNN